MIAFLKLASEASRLGGEWQSLRVRELKVTCLFPNVVSLSAPGFLFWAVSLLDETNKDVLPTKTLPQFLHIQPHNHDTLLLQCKTL